MSGFRDWLERHQLLVTGFAAVIAAGLAFSATVISAHMQASAAIEQAKASREAAKTASEASLAAIRLQLDADHATRMQSEANRRYALAAGVRAQVKTFAHVLVNMMGENELGNACGNFGRMKGLYPKIPELLELSWQDLGVLPPAVQEMIYQGRVSWRFEDFADASFTPVADSAGCNAFFKLRYPNIEKQETELENALTAVMADASK